MDLCWVTAWLETNSLKVSKAFALTAPRIRLVFPRNVVSWLDPFLSLSILIYLIILVSPLVVRCLTHGVLFDFVVICCNILQRTSGFDTPKLAAKDAAYACLVLGVFIAAYRSVSAARESVSVNPSRSVPFLFPLNSKETKPNALAAVFHHLSNRSAKQHLTRKNIEEKEKQTSLHIIISSLYVI